MAKDFGSTLPERTSSTPNRAIVALMSLLLLLSIGGAILLLGSCDSFLAGLATPTPTTAVQAAQAMATVLPRPSTTLPVTPIPSPTALSPATATPADNVKPVPLAIITGQVNADVVNVRSGPGTDYGILGQVHLDDKFVVMGRSHDGGWLHICCPFPDESGNWISTEYVDMTGAFENIPVDEAPAPPANPGAETAGAGEAAIASARNQAAPAPDLPGPGSFSVSNTINPLTGLPLADISRGQRPLIVCINNDFAARPQYGLGRADVMYEYLMEGFSITRFSGIFLGEQADRIGPVRSARLVNLYLGALYDAGLVCSGASDPVRFTLKNAAPFPYLDIDLDDPSNNRYSTSLGRDYRTRLQTSTDRLRRWLADWGAERPANLRGFTFGDIAQGGAPASVISIPYPQATASQVTYRYDVASGRYLRFMGGQPHLDGGSGTQVALDNVVVQYVPHQVTDIVEDSLGSRSIRLNLFGSGKAIVFRNGLAFEGSWRSESRGDTPHFFDNTGREIALKPGHTWISIVPLDYTVSYQ